MLVLCVDTATPQVGVSIGTEVDVMGQVRLTQGRRHVEQLAPAIRYLCDELGVTLDQLAAIGVDVGPGLFTGLRVGITTAKVMAHVLRIPVIGIPSLDLLAFAARYSDKLVVPVVDARRGEVFYAFYRSVPGGIQRISQYEVSSPQDLSYELMARGEDALVVGDGARLYEGCFNEVKRIELCSPYLAYPGPGALLELAVERYQREDFSTPWEIEPLYLRKSDAEINWEREQ